MKAALFSVPYLKSRTVSYFFQNFPQLTISRQMGKLFPIFRLKVKLLVSFNQIGNFFLIRSPLMKFERLERSRV